MSLYNTRNTKEVLSPLRVAEQNHVGADPHYCSLTGNLQVIPTQQRTTYQLYTVCNHRPSMQLTVCH